MKSHFNSKFTDEEKMEIVNLHTIEYISIKKISIKLNSCYDTIKKVIKENHGTPYSEVELKYLKFKSQLTDEIFLKLHHEEYMSLYAIMKKYGVREREMKRYVAETTIPIISKLNPRKARLMKKETPDILNKIQNMINHGASIPDIRAETGISRNGLTKISKRLNAKISTSLEKDAESNKFLISYLPKLMCDKSISEIKELFSEYNVYIEKLCKKIDKDGSIKKHRLYKNSLKYKFKDEIINLYQEKFMNATEISKYLKLSSDTVLKTLSIHGIELKTYYEKLWESKKHDIYEDYISNQRYTLSALGKKYSINPDYISFRLKNEFGVKISYGSLSEPAYQIFEYLKNDLGVDDLIINTREIIHPFEIDIYSETFKIGIEYHGIYWHLEENVGKYYHKNKWKKSDETGVRLIQIFADEWENKQDIVKSKLSHIFGKTNKRIYARNTTVSKLLPTQVTDFCEEHHIQGSGEWTDNVGLFHDEELVATMTVISKGHGRYVIDRYSSKYSIVGGFSKCLKFFEKKHSPTVIEATADLRWTDKKENVFLATGFTEVCITNPAYFYTTDFMNREPSEKYTKHKILKEHPHMDCNKTEKELMYELEFYPIYDAGNIKYKKEYK